MATWLFAFPARAAALNGMTWPPCSIGSGSQICPVIKSIHILRGGVRSRTSSASFSCSCSLIWRVMPCAPQSPVRLLQELVLDERPEFLDFKVTTILVPAHAQPSGGRWLQKLFSRFQQPCSSCGLFSTRSRGYDNIYVGRILPTGSRTVMASRAPALGLQLELSQARTSEKQPHQ